MTITTTTILDCGHTPTPQPAGSCTTGYGSDARGFTRCLACAEAFERSRFDECGEKCEPFVAYLSGDDKVLGSLKITTWTGAEIAQVISAHKIKAPRGDSIHGKYMLAYTARDTKGRLWYGRGSAGIVTYMRRKSA